MRQQKNQTTNVSYLGSKNINLQFRSVLSTAGSRPVFIEQPPVLTNQLSESYGYEQCSECAHHLDSSRCARLQSDGVSACASSLPPVPSRLPSGGAVSMRRRTSERPGSFRRPPAQPDSCARGEPHRATAGHVAFREHTAEAPHAVVICDDCAAREPQAEHICYHLRIILYTTKCVYFRGYKIIACHRYQNAHQGYDQRLVQITEL